MVSFNFLLRTSLASLIVDFFFYCFDNSNRDNITESKERLFLERNSADKTGEEECWWFYKKNHFSHWYFKEWNCAFAYFLVKKNDFMKTVFLFLCRYHNGKWRGHKFFGSISKDGWRRIRRLATWRRNSFEVSSINIHAPLTLFYTTVC